MRNDLVLSREQARAIDRIAVEEFGIPSLVLMENAGRGCADLLVAQGIAPSTPVVLCCGKGNKAGDGFVMARHLEIQNIPCEVLLFHPPQEFSGDAAVNYQILTRTDVPIHHLTLPGDATQLARHLEHASWVVDALLGTGSHGPARPPYDLVIDQINAAGRPVFSIDLPSGLDCDLGDRVEHCVRATVTGTMVGPKPGFRSPTGQQAVGKVHIVEIGIPRTVLIRIRGEE